MRRAQGLSVQVVVGIVLALIVLVVIAAIFFKISTEGSRTLSACETFGGQCMGGTSLGNNKWKCEQGTHNVFGDKSCQESNDGNICCVIPEEVAGQG